MLPVLQEPLPTAVPEPGTSSYPTQEPAEASPFPTVSPVPADSPVPTLLPEAVPSAAPYVSPQPDATASPVPDTSPAPAGSPVPGSSSNDSYQEEPASPDIVYLTNPEYETYVMSSLEALQVSQDNMAAASERLELQLEAVISIMLLVVVGICFNYIYKFFKLFF